MTRSSGYSESELMQMQQDAIRRVREMQERAQRTIAGDGWNRSTPEEPEPVVVEAEQVPAEEVPPSHDNHNNRPPQRNTGGGPLAGLNLGGLSNLFSGRTSSPIAGLLSWAGGERMIILLLLVLLMGEDTDQTLLLALFYLLIMD